MFTGARIWGSGTQSIPNATQTEVSLDTVQEDSGGFVAQVGGVNRMIIPPEGAGVYVVGAQIVFNQSAAFEADFMVAKVVGAAKDAILFVSDYLGAFTNVNSVLVGSVVVRLKAGDVLALYCDQYSGGAVDLTSLGPALPLWWLVYVGP